MTTSTKETLSSDFPLAGLAKDGWSTDTEATATCFCGAVQLAFPLTPPGLGSVFVCHCADCHKITASMFATNFTVQDSHLRHVRGQDNLKQFGQSETIARGHLMTNFFCQTCGTLMYRRGGGFPGVSILRVGTVDDFQLMEGVLRPRLELFYERRPAWLGEIGGDVERVEGMGGKKLEKSKV